MIVSPDLPHWVAVVTGLLVLIGAAITFIGAVGLVRLGNFYQRVHAPTLGTTCGMAFILLGSMLYFTALQSRPAVHEILIAVFVSLTTPVTLMLLARAALHRDRAEGNIEMPPNAPLPDPDAGSNDAKVPGNNGEA